MTVTVVTTKLRLYNDV